MSAPSNFPEPAIQWTISRAAEEFGTHRETLKKRLTQAGVIAYDNGRYSTKQICAAVFGDYHSEKTRLAKEQADKIALDNAERRQTLMKVEDALEITRRFCAAIRAKFLATSLPDDEKNAVLKEINRLAEVDLTELPEDEIKLDFE